MEEAPMSAKVSAPVSKPQVRAVRELKRLRFDGIKAAAGLNRCCRCCRCRCRR
jgi:hypothetical protein